MFDPHDRCCPDCGWEPEPVTERDRPSVNGDGSLVAFDDADFSYKAEFWRLIEAQRMAADYKPGWAAYRYKERFGDWPTLANGELVDTENATLEEKRAVYRDFALQADQQGFKPGWAAYRYKEIFGCWPKGFVKKTQDEIRRKALRSRFREHVRT